MIVDVLKKREVQLCIFAILASIAWPKIRHLFKEDDNSIPFRTDEKGIKLFTASELALCNGKGDNAELYLSILGSIYDVKKGFKHYGPDGSYHFFVGKFFFGTPNMEDWTII